MEPYIILTENNYFDAAIRDLQLQVNEHIDKGYSLFGAPFTTRDEPIGFIYISQAMFCDPIKNPERFL